MLMRVMAAPQCMPPYKKQDADKHHVHKCGHGNRPVYSSYTELSSRSEQNGSSSSYGRAPVG